MHPNQNRQFTMRAKVRGPRMEQKQLSTLAGIHSWSKISGQSREVDRPRSTGRLQHLSEPVFRNEKEQEYYQSKLTDEIGQKAVSLLTPYEARIWRQLTGRVEAAITDVSCYSKAELNVICKWLKLTKHLIDSGWAPEAIDQPRLELTK